MHESRDGAGEAGAGAGVDVDRRGFLGLAAAAMTGLVAACGGVVALVFAAAPALRAAKGAAADAAWSEVPDVGAGAPAEPTRHAVAVVSDAGWAKAQTTQAIFVDRDAGGHAMAFSARCPHEGCQVDWHGEQDKFVCPCHSSSWTRAGERLGGPTKRGLDPLEIRQTPSGGVEVRYVTFALDSAERIEIG